MNLAHLDPVTAASLIAAGVLALTRLLTTLKPVWERFPALLQGLFPVLVLVLPQIAAAALGVHTSLDLVNLIALSVALVLPGVHSHTLAIVKPSGPGSAALVLIVVVLALPLQACGSHVNWPSVLACGKPLEQPLLRDVEAVLAGTGDVDAELADLAKNYAPGVIECAVQELVGQLASAPHAMHASRATARGRAFLNRVTAQ